MHPAHHSPLLLLLLLNTALAQYTFVNNFYWQDYTNDCEATCLTNVFNVQQCTLANACNSSTCLTLDDSCLCGTSSWLTAVSQCVGKSCGAGAVYDAAAITSNACNSSGTAMSMSEDKIIQVGLAAGPSTTQVTGVQPTSSTTTTPSKPTNSSTAPSDGGSGGLSTKLQVIIGVVTSIVGVVVAIVGVFFAWKTYKHSKYAHRQTGTQHNIEAASSTTALTALPAGRARGSMSEEPTSQGNQPLPPSPPLPPAAVLRRDDI
jgi:hypothetical protein